MPEVLKPKEIVYKCTRCNDKKLETPEEIELHRTWCINKVEEVIIAHSEEYFEEVEGNEPPC